MIGLTAAYKGQCWRGHGNACLAEVWMKEQAFSIRRWDGRLPGNFTVLVEDRTKTVALSQ